MSITKLDLKINRMFTVEKGVSTSSLSHTMHYQITYLHIIIHIMLCESNIYIIYNQNIHKYIMWKWRRRKNKEKRDSD